MRPHAFRGREPRSKDLKREVGLTDALQSVAPIDLLPTNPFLASVDRLGRSLDNIAMCPVAGAQQVAPLPLADAVVAPPDVDFPFSHMILPGFHGGIIESPSRARLIADVLRGSVVHQSAAWDLAERVTESAASAWQVPDLDASDFSPPPKASRSILCCPRQ